MTIITVPEVVEKKILSGAEIIYQPVDFMNRGMFNMRRQVLAFPTAYLWIMRTNIGEVEESEAAVIRSFMMKLRGRTNTFRFKVPGYRGRVLSGYAGDAGLVNGGSQLGSSLATDGWSNSTQILADGEYITVNDELKVVDGDISSNGSGQATITFNPPLRQPPPDNAPIVIDRPHALMCKAESEVVARVSAPYRSQYDLICEEAVDRSDD